MKKILCLFMCLGIAVCATAQRPYFCVTEGAVLEYTTYNPSSEVTGSSRTTIKSVAFNGNGNYDITYVTEVMDNEGNPLISPMEISTSIKDGNMSAALGNVGVTVTGDVPFIPSRLAIGQQLQTGTMKISTMGMTMTSTITDHQVTEREELETPAGTFKCYVVSQTTNAKMMGMNVEGTTLTWYARGIGAVQIASYDAKDNLISAQILTNFNN